MFRYCAILCNTWLEHIQGGKWTVWRFVLDYFILNSIETIYLRNLFCNSICFVKLTHKNMERLLQLKGTAFTDTKTQVLTPVLVLNIQAIFLSEKYRPNQMLANIAGFNRPEFAILKKKHDWSNITEGQTITGLKLHFPWLVVKLAVMLWKVYWNAFHVLGFKMFEQVRVQKICKFQMCRDIVVDIVVVHIDIDASLTSTYFKIEWTWTVWSISECLRQVWLKSETVKLNFIQDCP